MFFYACVKFYFLFFTFYTFISSEELYEEDQVVTTDEEYLESIGFYTKPPEVRLKELDYSYWCKFQHNAYNCAPNVERSRFYYDIKMQDCLTFTYSGCPTKFNNFITLEDCHEHCTNAGIKPITVNTSHKISCRLQPDFGTCDGYKPMWYYDINERICKGFSWSGCGGNLNRFETQQVCTMICPSLVEY